MKPLLLAFCLIIAAGSSARCGEKDHYTLFNPVPSSLMRPLSADRPDLTESPFTVDAGHFQIEADLLSHIRDRSAGETFRRFALLPVNLKAGLLNNLDLQIGLEPLIFERLTESGRTGRQTGFGDMTVRLKWNLWGNDGGTTAAALMPFVKIPTASRGLGNGSVEGGVILPVAVELPAPWSLGLMGEVDVIRSDAGHRAELIGTVVLGRELTDVVAAYVEFFAQADPGRTGDWQAILGTGVTYAITGDLQLDAGVNFGLTESAPEVNPFAGLTIRF